MWVSLHYHACLCSKEITLIGVVVREKQYLSYSLSYSLIFSCLIVVEITHMPIFAYNLSHPKNHSPYCNFINFATVCS